MAAAALCFASVAGAQGLNGTTLGLSYLFPEQSSEYQNYGSAVVGGGTEWTDVVGVFDVDVADGTVTTNYNCVGLGGCTPGQWFWSGANFNGFRLSDFNGTIPDFTNWTLISTNIVGLDASRLSFDANNVYVNWQGLAFDDNSTATFGITATPEPASMALLATGLAGLGAYRRRRARKNVA